MTPLVLIDHHIIGTGHDTFVIAEVGSNHDRKLTQAKQLIEAAAQSGADAVKFQLFSAEDLYAPGQEAYQLAKRVELPPEWVPELAAYARTHGIGFLASAFSREAVDCLEGEDVAAYKVASSEAVNLPLLKYMASKHKPILLSTGMCDLADVQEAIEVIDSEQNRDIILLQCTSLYPTEPEHVHLNVMDTLRTAFQLPVGLSDHTTGIVIPIAAVARGADVIEKHLTLSRTLDGPDHGYALEPHEFKEIVEAIRATEKALGLGVKTMLAEEVAQARRTSIRAARDIRVGEVLTPSSVTVEAPAGGIRSRFLNLVVGRPTHVAIARGEVVTWEKIGRTA